MQAQKRDAWRSILTDPSLAWVFFLGFSSGLPLALTGTTLQAWYTAEGLSITAIGMLSLVGIPYNIKFLWAPFFDYLKWPFLGRRRGWMLVTQIALLILLVFTAFNNPGKAPYLLAFVAFAITACSASQDIAVDAYRTEILSPQERGLGTALYVAAYRISMLVAGGFALILADSVGFKVTYLVMAGLMGIGIITTLFSREPVAAKNTPRTLTEAVVLPWRDFFGRKQAVLLLLLVVLYKFGDAFVAQLTTPFLIREVGFTLQEIGLLLKSVGMGGTILGAICGGLFIARWSLFRCLLVFGVLQAISNLLYCWLAIVGHNYTAFVTAIFVENFCGGLGTAAFMAFLMSLCNPRFTAAQFALLTAFSAVGRQFLGPLAGWLVDSYGWLFFFIVTFFAALPGLFLLWYLAPTVREEKDFSAESVVA